MPGFSTEDAVLFRAECLEQAVKTGFERDTQVKGGDECNKVLRLAKEFCQGELALFAQWEDDNGVTVLDDLGRTWCALQGMEVESALRVLLELATHNYQLFNQEFSWLTPWLEVGQRLDSLILKEVQAAEGKPGLLIVALKNGNLITPRENHFLGIFVENLGLAWRNSKLAAQVDRLGQAFAALEEIGTVIARTTDFEEVLGTVLQKLEQLTGAESGGVLLYDGEKQELVLQRPAFGAQKEVITLYRVSVRQDRPTEGLAVEVFLRRQSYVCNDAPGDKKSNQQYIKLFGVRNFMTIPLVIENKGIGVLHLVNKREGYFTEQDVQLLTILASELAVLIENARLINQTKQQEREATALFQVGMEISAFLDLEAILQSVVHKVRLLLDCDMAAISILEENGQYVHMTYVTRDALETVRQLRVVPGKGLTGSVLDSHQPLACVFGPQPPELIREYDDIDIMVLAKGVCSAVAVPLATGEKIHGELYGWRKNDESFSSQAVGLLTRFSNQAVLAIENARLYTGQREALARLQSSKEVIESQHARLARSVSIHKEFTQMVLDGKGIKSIASTLAQMVDGQVEVTDQFFHLIAGSSDSPASKELEHLFQPYAPAEVDSNRKMREFFELLGREKVPVRLPSLGNRVVAPVVVGTDVLGYVFIQENEKNLGEIDIMAVEHASTVIALEMIKEKNKSEIISRLKGDCLDDLLSANYKSEREILDRANYLGYDLAKPFQVLVVDIDNFSDFVVKQQGDEGLVARVKQQMFEMINKVVADKSPHSIITGKSDSIVILAHTGGPGEDKGNRMLSPLELAGEIKTKLSQVFTEITVSIGVGKVAHHLKEIRESHQEAITCLNILKKFSRRNIIISFEQLGVYRLLHKVEDIQELVSFAKQVLQPLEAYDEKFGTMLVDTLRSYVENNHNLQKTAKSSYLHSNTLIYRLKRIQEIAKLDLNEPEQRLNVQVALKILDMLPREGNN